MQKLISFAVPCFNSSAYMGKCIDSLLKGGDCVEIIIVNDGSAKDNTAEIADAYAAQYPAQIKAVHQANAGHGGAVNAGLKHATGKYFKVVDSDDYLEETALKQVIATLQQLEDNGTPVDALFANYVYDKQGAAHKKAVNYRSFMPQGRIFTWEETKLHKLGQNLLMHSMIYRRQLLLDCGVKLPKHTFYVDNLLAYLPIPHMNKLYYVDVNLYMYFIGRDDQSVNETVMVRRQDQQLRVTEMMILQGNLNPNIGRKRRNYMMSYLNQIMMVSTVMFYVDGGEAALAKKKAMWALLKQTDKKVYSRLRRSIFGIVSHLPGAAGRKFLIWTYRQTQKIYGFN